MNIESEGNPEPQASQGNTLRRTAALAALCVVAGAVPFSYGFISNDIARFLFTVAVAGVYLAVTLLARRNPNLRKYWELASAFLILAVVGVFNNLAHYFGTYVLNSPPVTGDPLAGSVTASVIVQLVETLVAIVPILLLTKAFGFRLSSVYAQRGRLRGLFIVAIGVFVLLLVFTARHDSSFFMTNPSSSQTSFLALAPALLVMVVSNGFQEEFLFRALFLQRYSNFFSAPVSIILTATVFGYAHLGVTYTPSALIFILVAVFPLGLATAYMMHKTNGVLTPAILHSGFDLPIYWAFLTYVA